ncbi:MAG: energy-coupled thiamine transporter ThiT [Christensenellales bacterium]|jgi:thiamine transporter
MKNSSVRALVEGGISVAMAIALSFLKFPSLPFGGSVDLVMVPLLVYALRRGMLWGCGAGLVAGLLKSLVGGGIGWGLPSVLMDYVLAYGMAGLAGLASGKKAGWVWGSVLGCAARYAVHVLSGVVLYAITEPTLLVGLEFMGAFTSPWTYSLAYNALYMLPNTLLAVAVLAILRAAYEKALLPADGKKSV